MAEICLRYVSRSLVSGDLGTLEDIRTVSRANNAARGITGALYYDAAGFFQVLEGTRMAVLRLMETIAADPRHTDVEVLDVHEIVVRRFARWSMKTVSGFCDPALAARFDRDRLSLGGAAVLERRTAALMKI